MVAAPVRGSGESACARRGELNVGAPGGGVKQIRRAAGRRAPYGKLRVRDVVGIAQWQSAGLWLRKSRVRTPLPTPLHPDPCGSAGVCYFSVNVISRAIWTRTAFPFFFPGWNVHWRAAMTACQSRSSSSGFVTVTSPTLPSVSTMQSRRTVPSIPARFALAVYLGFHFPDKDRRRHAVAGFIDGVFRTLPGVGGPWNLHQQRNNGKQDNRPHHGSSVAYDILDASPCGFAIKRRNPGRRTAVALRSCWDSAPGASSSGHHGRCAPLSNP